MIKSLPNLYSFLGLSKDQVEEIIKDLNSYYYLKASPKRKFGKYQKNKNGTIPIRYLTIPRLELKILQQKIATLLAQLENREYMYGSIAGVNNLDNACRHLNKKYFLKIDLKNFFTNITHHQVFQVFISHAFSPSVSRFLTKLTTYKSSLPQGAPTSPIISNLVFLNTADTLNAIARANNIVFTTFLDDLVFSSIKDFKVLIPKILEIIRSNNFFPSQKKIKYRTNSCEITGLLVRGNRLSVIKEMKKEAKCNVHLNSYVRLVSRYNSRIDQIKM